MSNNDEQEINIESTEGCGKVGKKAKKSLEFCSINDSGRIFRSRQSARECRQRKKARYKKLDDAIMIKESENLEIIRKIERLQQVSIMIDNGGSIPSQELETIRNDLHLLPNILRRYHLNNGTGSS